MLLFPLSERDWPRIRTRYCILKSLVVGPKSVPELLVDIKEMKELRKVRSNISFDENYVQDVVNGLNSEWKIKKRRIFNTITKDSRVEYFLSPEWKVTARVLRKEISIADWLEKIANEKKKAEQRKQEKEKKEAEQRKLEEEERERELLMRAKVLENEKIKNEKSLPLKSIKSKSSNSTQKSVEVDNSEKNEVFNGILGMIGFSAALVVINKFGNALSNALTFPVFVIGCAVVGIFYYLKDKS